MELLKRLVCLVFGHPWYYCSWDLPERAPSGALIWMRSRKCRRCGKDETKEQYTDEPFLGGY